MSGHDSNFEISDLTTSLVKINGDEISVLTKKRPAYVQNDFVPKPGVQLPSIKLTSNNREEWIENVSSYFQSIGVMYHVNVDRRPEIDCTSYQQWKFDDIDARYRILMWVDKTVRPRVEAGKTARQVWHLCTAETGNQIHRLVVAHRNFMACSPDKSTVDEFVDQCAAYFALMEKAGSVYSLHDKLSRVVECLPKRCAKIYNIVASSDYSSFEVAMQELRELLSRRDLNREE